MKNLDPPFQKVELFAPLFLKVEVDLYNNKTWFGRNTANTNITCGR
jgi:hypothetical protein